MSRGTPSSDHNQLLLLQTTAPTPRPLSIVFEAIAKDSETKEFKLVPSLTPSVGGRTPIRYVKILSDRIFAVNELGVIEMHHWKLLSPPPREENNAAAVVSHMADTVTIIDENEETPARKKTSSWSMKHKLDDVHSGSPISRVKTQSTSSKWTLYTERDTSRFDVIPRVPMYASSSSSSSSYLSSAASSLENFPISVSCQGRMIVTGGSPTGTMHVRLIDLENGHVIARASVDGHVDIVTCLAMDNIGEEEFLVSGSRYIITTTLFRSDMYFDFRFSCLAIVMKHHDIYIMSIFVCVLICRDTSVLLWQFSHMNSPFRLPRIASSPLMVFHSFCIIIIIIIMIMLLLVVVVVVFIYIEILWCVCVVDLSRAS